MAIPLLIQKHLYRMSFVGREQTILRKRFAAHPAQFMPAAVNDRFAVRAAALALEINSPGKVTRTSNFELLGFPLFDFAHNRTHAL